MTENLILKITSKGASGFQISSVPKQKLKRLAKCEKRFCKLEGDMLVLSAY